MKPNMNERKLRKIEDEQWKELTFTDKKYEISNYGRIKSYCYDKVDGRIVKLGNIKGFYNVSLRVKGQKKSFLVHKLTAEYFVDKTADDQDVVIHLDWNKQNNYISNLQWVTKAESYKRMHKVLQEARKKAGKVVTSSKLSKDDVAVIKGMLEKGVKQNLIAKLFCVSEMQVSRIARKENWPEIEPKM
ncbi:NUMOD4 domain-containing protein [Carboxylicivirga marina]|uniref:HNH endonuclease n=1 Tax=Carboxylicivirga marina TaxID=2800988 RepID=A0ABS1HDQ9_9BACT|nr:NUMOD4 domain-containing protein [Carboxylicivirga marina]MBK3515807.1 HNH endonuclease [Carboxylicivirga marina]